MATFRLTRGMYLPLADQSKENARLETVRKMKYLAKKSSECVAQSL